ncbi:MAG TPA: tetratricopeptide repeat protein [Mycobacterium sp.]|nr:tetratricopeptide repeat protein [Mycobacterium sp.]
MAKNLVLNRTRKVPAEDTAAFGAIAERFRRAGALERAVELCREGLQKFPDHISARVTLGWSLLDLGKYDDARVELEQVLRRAPDNLAAIRGLAELHDRFEHTLHLPMDGPGQWPPPPESMDEAAGGDVSAPDQEAADTDLEMSPAALGIPIWSAAVSPATPEPELETPPAQTASVQATAPAPTTAAAAAPVTASATVATPAPAPVPTPAAAPPPVATQAAAAVAPAPAPPVAAAPVAPAALAASEPVKAEPAASGSGMSSVREIDFANAPSVSVSAPAMEEPPVAAVEARAEVAETTDAAPDAYAVSDADIQALLAEAQSLDDAAVPAAAAEETVSLDAMALGTEDPLSAVAEIAPPAAVVSYTSVTEPISVDLDLETPPGGIAIPQFEQGVVTAEAAAPVVEAAVEATSFMAEPELNAEELFEAALEVAAPIVEAALEIEEPASAAFAKEEPAVAAFAQEAPVVAAQAEPEAAPEPEIEIAAAIEVSPAPESAPEIDVVSEVEVAPAIEAVAAAEVVELAAVATAEVVSIEVGRTAAQSPLPALERFLTKVQARRAQLMAESVA